MNPTFDSSRVDAAILAFDDALAGDPAADLVAFLPAGAERFPALVGMVRIALERACLRASSGEAARVEYYLARFPELGESQETLAELVATERDCRMRALAGEFRTRFPNSPFVPFPEAVHLLAEFEIRREIGRGTMGVVYHARQKRLGRDVALKILHVAGATLDSRRRFEREARLIAGCGHPQIVQLFEAGEADGVPYLAMEFCSGGSLEQRLDQRRLPAKEAAALLATLARAVHHAHLAGVVHRDLKPANILFAADGSPRVADFGLARLQEEAAELTPPAADVGTPAYAAPEQLGRSLGSSPASVGAAADVYALGGILYCCLTGRLPFVGATVAEVVTAKLTSDPVPLRQIERSVPRDLETICLKCLARGPSRRYASAEALAEDLERFLAGLPIVARPAGWLERVARWCGRNPALAGLYGVLVVAVVLFAGMFAWADSERRRAEAAGQEAASHFQTARELLHEYAWRSDDDRFRQADKFRVAQRELLVKAVAFYHSLERGRPEEPDLLLGRAELYAQLADLAHWRGLPSEGFDWVNRCAELVEHPTLLDPKTPALRLRLAQVLLRVMGMRKEARWAAYSVVWGRRAIALREAVGATDRQARLDLCRNRYHLAGLTPPTESLALLLQAQIELRQLEASEPGLDLRSYLGLTLVLLGRVYQALEQPARERECWREAVEMLHTEAKESPGDGRPLLDRLRASERLEALGAAGLPADEWVSAAQEADRRFQAWQQGDPEAVAVIHYRVRLRELLAAAAERKGKREQALASIQEAVALLEAWKRRHPADSSGLLLTMRMRLLMLGDADSKNRDRVVTEVQQLLLRCGHEPATREWACGRSSAVILTLRHEGNLSQAQELASQVTTFVEGLVREHPEEGSYLGGLSEAWTQQGKNLWRTDQHEKTKHALRQAIEPARTLAERNPANRGLLDERLRRLGKFLEEREDFAALATCLEERARLAEHDPALAEALERDYQRLTGKLPKGRTPMR